ncbi:hypothetical protein SDC9_201165 [bioreactor metagenome]|uniref:Uncharacterized protein n=1 Tax=bioreactor metagenome TaxID=1076179 RepID=A0A645IQ85_9ZZZZ
MQWQPDPEHAALARRAADVDAPPVLADDVIGHRQAESGPLADRLGGVEGLEDVLHDLRRHALAGVFDLDPGKARVGAGTEGDGAVLVDGVGCVDQQVHHHLVDLRQDAGHWWEGGVFAHHVCLVLEFVPHHIERAFDTGVQVCIRPLGLIDAGKVLQVGDDLAHTVDAAA